MPNHLDLPAELNSLVEKREQEDRRQEPTDEQAKSSDSKAPAVERRSGEDRRANDS